MNFTTAHIKAKLTEMAQTDNDQAMLNAIKTNTFYVIASNSVGNTIYIGCMDEYMPAVFSTLDEANSENEDIAKDYLEDIAAGERDEDDEWDGEVMRVSLVNDDEIAFYEVSGPHSDEPVVTCKIKDSTGH